MRLNAVRWYLENAAKLSHQGHDYHDSNQLDRHQCCNSTHRCGSFGVTRKNFHPSDEFTHPASPQRDIFVFTMDYKAYL